MVGGVAGHAVRHWLDIARSLPRGVYDYKGQCYNFSGWPGEEVRCEKLPGSESHEGSCEYPVASTKKEEDQVTDEQKDSLIKMFEAQLLLTNAVLHVLRGGDPNAIEAPPVEKKKARGTVKRGEDTPPVDLRTVMIEHPCGCKVTQDRATSTYCAEHQKNMDAAKALAASGGATAQSPIVPIQKEQPALGGHPHDDNAADLAAKKASEERAAYLGKGGALLSGDVTIEMLRAKSVEFTDTKKGFGMEAWLELAQKITGKKAVKDIPKEMYGAFYGAMDVELAKKAGTLAPDPVKTEAPAAAAAPAVEKKPEPVKAAPAASSVTLDTIKPAAKAFMDVAGQPAFVAVLKAFGAVKLSEVDPAKYPALLEAITNA